MTVDEAREIAKDGFVVDKCQELAQKELEAIYRSIEYTAKEGRYYTTATFGNLTDDVISTVINQLAKDGYKLKLFGIFRIWKIEICWKPKKDKTKKEHSWLWNLFH